MRWGIGAGRGGGRAVWTCEAVVARAAHDENGVVKPTPPTLRGRSMDGTLVCMRVLSRMREWRLHLRGARKMLYFAATSGVCLIRSGAAGFQNKLHSQKRVTGQ